MEEQSRHISRAVVIFACPFIGIVHCCPVCQFSGNLRIHRITVEFVFSVTDQTVLVHKATAYTVSNFFTTSADTQIMFMRRSPVAINFSKPVCIGICTCIHIPFSLRVGSGNRWYLPCLVIDNTLHYFGTENGTLTGICRCCIKILCELIRIHHFRNLQSICKTDVTGIADICFSGFTAFGCDHDNTERCTCSVNRSGCRILQNWNWFDIVRVDRIHVSFDTVDQDERGWSWTVANRTGTTDIYIHCIIQRTATTVYGEVQTRNNSL